MLGLCFSLDQFIKESKYNFHIFVLIIQFSFDFFDLQS